MGGRSEGGGWGRAEDEEGEAEEEEDGVVEEEEDMDIQLPSASPPPRLDWGAVPWAREKQRITNSFPH